MPTSFIQVVGAISNVVGVTSVTAGNLLITAFADSGSIPSGISDSRGNTWHNVVLVEGIDSVSVWWAIANTTGSLTVTVTDSPSNAGMFVAEYSGPSGMSGIGVLKSIVVSNPSPINTGAINVVAGAITIVYNFGQSTAYTSTSGGTGRTSPFGAPLRLELIDNVSATGSYAETGSITGSNQFGGVYQIFGLGQASARLRTLVGTGL